MDTSIAAERQVLVGWARQILAALGKRADVAAIQEVTQAINGLLSDRFCLAVLGKAKRGKSTLLNAVLGRKDDTLAPVDKLPASSAISRFRWADTERATVAFRDGRQEQIGVERIREFVTEEFNKENAKGVNLVEIEGPFPRLDHHVEMVDTPGPVRFMSITTRCSRRSIGRSAPQTSTTIRDATSECVAIIKVRSPEFFTAA